MPRNLNRAIGARPRIATAIPARSFTMLAVLGTGLAVAACYNFNVTDPNGPTLQGLINNPTRANVNAAVTGVFARSRANIEGLIWFGGSMGREGINLSGNNQPDYSEPYYGPLSGGGDAAGQWGGEYAVIRDADLVIDAAKAPDMSVAERALAVGVAQAEKALMFMYIVETHGALGAPVDVDRAPTAPLAPFVNEDGVYATILATLDSSLTNLAAGSSANFSFPTPPGYAMANTPATFRQFVWALEAKALCFRATAALYDATSGGGGAGPAAGYYAAAILAVDSSFFVPGAANFANGVYFDFSNSPSDITNGLSDAITGATFFADTFNITDAQLQASSALDQRVLNKIVSITSVGDSAPQILGGIPQIEGWLKFSIYLSNGAPNTGAPIPVIKDEELALLKAEAEIGTGDFVHAVQDLDTVRVGSGQLPVYSGPVTLAGLTTELLYNRRYSLLWEQAARWIDARRFNQLGTIEPGWNPAAYPTFPAPAVPTRWPIPSTECQARNLGSVCNPLGT